MCFNTAKCKVTHVGPRNAGHIYRTGDRLLANSDSEECLKIIVEQQLNIYSYCDSVVKRTSATITCKEENSDQDRRGKFTSSLGKGVMILDYYIQP